LTNVDVVFQAQAAVCLPHAARHRNGHVDGGIADVEQAAIACEDLGQAGERVLGASGDSSAWGRRTVSMVLRAAWRPCLVSWSTKPVGDSRADAVGDRDLGRSDKNDVKALQKQIRRFTIEA